jgi:protein-disulfide isomerase
VKYKGLLSAVALVSAMIPHTLLAEESNTNTNANTSANTNVVTPAQKTEIEKIVREYLIANPEVLLEASQALQQKQQQAMQKQAQTAIKSNADQLFTDKLTTVGNPKGQVTLVEFFDYQCRHCKDMSPVISDLIKSDSNLRVVYKEFPIFGESSDLASKAALAAAMQNKYVPMHDALIGQKDRLDEKIINEAAKSIGLDMNKFKADMNSKEVTAALEANRKLAEKLRLMGTPAFIVAATPKGDFKEGTEVSFIPGAASREALLDLIKKAKGNS